MKITGSSSQTRSMPDERPAFLRLLIVDDDNAIRNALQDVALSLGYSTFIADSAEHAYRFLDSQHVDILLLDLRLPGADGLQALREIKQRWPETIVIVVTGYGTVQSAVHAMKNGAYDFVTKPFGIEELKALLQRVQELLKLKTENRVLRERINSRRGFANMIGQAPEMEKLYRIIAKAAFGTHPVLITGDAGTGKEMVARSIHLSGPAADKPFIAVDCGSLSSSRLEEELFGRAKGTPNQGLQCHEGLLSAAKGGTIFLDEISELPVDLQAKLLRAIQEKEICPLGSAKRTKIDVRILAATEQDLEQLVAQGEFRKDLFSRLNILTAKIPPLCKRRQDIPLLAAHFLERISRNDNRERTLSDGAHKLLLEYSWPGNVRELENCLERTCAQTSGPIIHSSNVALNLKPDAQAFFAKDGSANIIPMIEIERQTILNTLTQLNGDKLMAARLLGIGKTTLYRKLKEYASQDISSYQSPTFS